MTFLALAMDWFECCLRSDAVVCHLGSKAARQGTFDEASAGSPSHQASRRSRDCLDPTKSRCQNWKPQARHSDPRQAACRLYERVEKAAVPVWRQQLQCFERERAADHDSNYQHCTARVT